MYAGFAGDADVVMSAEHSDAVWMRPADYAAKHWSEATAQAAPQWAPWMREIRRNCDTASAWAARHVRTGSAR